MKSFCGGMGELFTKSAPIIKREAQKINPCGLRAAPVLDTICGLQIIGGAATENTKNTKNTGFLFGAAQKAVCAGYLQSEPLRHKKFFTFFFPVRKKFSYRFLTVFLPLSPCLSTT